MTDTHMERWLALERALTRVRSGTMGIVNPLDYAAVHRQFDPIMSPVVWDIGHVGSFEELWLLREVDGRQPHDERLDGMYDAFDNPRWTRSELPLLDREEALVYLENVRHEALSVMRRKARNPETDLLRDGYVYDMIVQHEAQHQETILQALDLRSDLAPYLPAQSAVTGSVPGIDDTDRVSVPSGAFTMGTNDRQSAYDNERPAHQVVTESFWIDRFPVTNRRFDEFVRANGYQRQEYWSAAGWEWLADTGHAAPHGWEPASDGGWYVRRFGHLRPMNPNEPVQHVSFYEAEAFAAFAGGRLPTEPEWEKAALWNPATGASSTYPWGEGEPTVLRANLDQSAFGPMPVGSLPDGASKLGVQQMVGDVHEWTTSGFDAYPGYATFPYPEYSEVFFGGDYRVLRGSSWASSRHVARGTFRNWDHPIRRQIFSGIRLAWDVD